MRRALSLFACVLLAACAAEQEPKLIWQRVDYADIAGWKQDRHEEGLTAFRRSCLKIKMPTLCAAAQEPQTRSQARQFFEAHFTPYRISGPQGDRGLLTGYYLPLFSGSLTQTPRFRYPVYGLPPEVKAGTPHLSRAEIEAGALKGRGLEIAWVDDPVMLFFLHIQGSGRLVLPDGQLIELRYAGKNNHPYVAIGKLLIERGALTRDNVSLQTIRQWLYDHPQEAAAVMNANPSYVFFTRHAVDAPPPGAQGVPLTPERSLAVDPAFMAYGTPLFIDTTVAAPQPYFRRLLVAQDTGGAIRGPLRGDIFFGQGEAAEERAGRQRAPGRWVALKPNNPL